ncbi:Magnesium transporter ALR1 [Smittium culicis]|uniref:Magnesium transporter ALR1 n=1 Tax=Smittium culicis TaxID=133412 RepID=A0A1R1XRR9_9FUNG|nr:Magnesium transporter ALR1 [Smittium culicis]
MGNPNNSKPRYESTTIFENSSVEEYSESIQNIPNNSYLLNDENEADFRRRKSNHDSELLGIEPAMPIIEENNVSIHVIPHSADEVRGSLNTFLTKSASKHFKHISEGAFTPNLDKEILNADQIDKDLASITSNKFNSPMEVINVNFPHSMLIEPDQASIAPKIRVPTPLNSVPLISRQRNSLSTQNRWANLDSLEVFLKRNLFSEDNREEDIYFSADSDNQSGSDGESEKLEEMNLLEYIKGYTENTQYIPVNENEDNYNASLSRRSSFCKNYNSLYRKNSNGPSMPIGSSPDIASQYYKRPASPIKLTKEQRLKILMTPETQPLLKNFNQSNAGYSSTDYNRRKLDMKKSFGQDLSTYLDNCQPKAKRIMFYSPTITPVRANSLETISHDEIGNLTNLLKHVEQSNSCFWLDILAPSNSEIRILSKTFKIHPLTAEDIIENEDSIRSKVDVYSNYYFLVLDLLNYQQYSSNTSSFGSNQSDDFETPHVTYIIVTKLGVLSFHTMPTCRRSIILRWLSQLQSQTIITPDWINYAIMDDLTDQVLPLVHSIELEVETIDELVLILSSSEQSDMLLRIGTSRKKLMCILRLLQGKSDALRTLIKMFTAANSSAAASNSLDNALLSLQQKQQLPNCSQSRHSLISGTSGRRDQQSSSQLYGNEAYQGLKNLTPTNQNFGAFSGGSRTPNVDIKFHDINYYLEDILDHVVTMSENASHLEQVLSRAYSNYLAKISIELTESSNRTNDVIAKLSILASVLIPLNLITGLWGMNVKVPGQDQEGIAWFMGIVLCIFSFVIFSVFICVRLGLI